MHARAFGAAAVARPLSKAWNKPPPKASWPRRRKSRRNMAGLRSRKLFDLHLAADLHVDADLVAEHHKHTDERTGFAFIYVDGPKLSIPPHCRFIDLKGGNRTVRECEENTLEPGQTERTDDSRR